MTARSLVFGGAMLLASMSAGAPAARAQGSGSATLDTVRARGVLMCGVSGVTAGFSLPDSTSVMRGIDADGCRAVAAAVLGDGSKVRFVVTTTQNRFTALQSGEVDLLVRVTTWTMGREGNQGLLFAATNFYDGTGFLVKASSGVKSAKELDGATICVQPGTSTELAVTDHFRVNGMRFTPVLIENVGEGRSAFLSGRCDAYSTDASSLAAFRFEQGARAADLALLPEIVSKEPLGAMVRKGDDRWFDVVRWTHFATLTAEENGVTRDTLDDALKSANPEVRRLLGLEGDLGKSVGLSNSFAYDVIKAVGNYGEIWSRNIAPMGVPRGLNNLWNKGGLQYAPPMR